MSVNMQQMTAAAADSALAADFAALVRSPEGQQIVARYGFLAGD